MTQSARWSVSTTSKQLLAEGLRSRPSRHDGIGYDLPGNGTPKPVHAVRAPGGLEACGSDRVTNFAQQMRWSEAYPASEKIRVVLAALRNLRLGVRKRLEHSQAQLKWQRSLGQASPAPAYCR